MELLFYHASLYALIAVAAWTFARGERRAHRTIALMFGWELVANIGRLLGDEVLNPATPPYEGGLLVVYYLDHAFVLSFRFVLVAACLRHFARASMWPALYGFVAAMITLVLIKEQTGINLQPVHHAAAAATTGICWALVVRAVLAPAAQLRQPDAVHAILLAILALVLVKVCLQYFGPLDDTWTDVRKADTLVHGVVAVGYLSALARDGVRRWRASRS